MDIIQKTMNIIQKTMNIIQKTMNIIQKTMSIIQKTMNIIQKTMNIIQKTVKQMGKKAIKYQTNKQSNSSLSDIFFLVNAGLREIQILVIFIDKKEGSLSTYLCALITKRTKISFCTAGTSSTNTWAFTIADFLWKCQETIVSQWNERSSQ